MYAQLLIDLFKYLAPFLRNVELNKPMQILYKVSSPCWQPPACVFVCVCVYVVFFVWAFSGHAPCAAGPAARFPRVPL